MATQERLALAMLSIRSGLDALLQACAFPPGSEVLVSAVTIRDMVVVIEAHGLRAVPVDIDPKTCALNSHALVQRITPNTKAILVAHLFGSRMPMQDVAHIAHAHNLQLWEDCAQAYAADGYEGHPSSDVVMFSFGPIKTATALGGALLLFRQLAMKEAVEKVHQTFPSQTHAWFARRVVRYAGLKALSQPAVYGAFACLCRWWGTTHDAVVSRAVRGFAGGELLHKIRHRPPQALLALMDRRLRQADPSAVQRRAAFAQQVIAQLLEAQPGLKVPGANAEFHTHWVVPLQVDCPDELVRHLWTQGLDATRGASSLYAVPSKDHLHCIAEAAERMMSQLVYLPVDAAMSPVERDRLIRAVREFFVEHERPV